MRFGRSVCGVVLTALVGSGVALAPARSAGDDSAAAVAVEPSDETALPRMYRQDPPVWTAYGSSDYVVSPVTTGIDAGQPHRNLIRVSDGAVVRSLAVDATGGVQELPPLRDAVMIVDDKMLTWDKRGFATTVAIEDLATGETSAYSLPAHEQALVRPDWAVTTSLYGSGEALFLQRPGETPTRVAGPFDSCRDIYLVDSDADGLIFTLGCGEENYLHLTIATGVVEPVPGRFLTPQRVIGTSYSADGYDVTWAPRDDTAQVSTTRVALPAGTAFATLGDDLVAPVAAPCEGERCGRELREVDLRTGEIGDVLLRHVVAHNSNRDGTLVATVDDGGSGELVMLRPGDEPRTVTALPPQWVTPRDVSLSGSRVVAVTDEIVRDPIREYVGSAWSNVTDPATGGPLGVPSLNGAGSIEVAGDAIAVRQTDGGQRLVWPGGTRLVDPVAWGSIMLGHRGRLVGISSRADDGVWSLEVQELRTGTVLWKATDSKPTMVLDGTWVWRVVNGHLEGADTAHPGPVRRIPLNASCASGAGLRDVRGRWAMVDCGGTYVLDLRQSGAAYELPAYRGYGKWMLGNDFAFDVADDPAGPIRAVDFSSAHTTRQFGQGATWAVADDAGGHDLVWNGPFGQLVRGTLDWVSTPPIKPDATAPRLTSTGGSPRYVPDIDGRRTVGFSWTYVDPSIPGQSEPTGVASYDVRWRTGVPGSGVWTSWTTLSRTTQRSVSRTFREERNACFQVRARDRSGNLSPWSGTRCTGIDGKAPNMYRTYIDTYNRDVLQFVYKAYDLFAVSHYRVSYRKGPDSAQWITLKGWDHRVMTNVYVPKDGRRTCFRAIAVDKVGRTDSAIRCTS